MIAVADQVGGASWIDYFNERETRWSLGLAAQPLTDFRRYELPKAKYDGGEVPIELIDALTRVDPTFEIIFDRFTQVNCHGPGHHVVRRYESGGVLANDKLRLEVSIQSDLARDDNWIWPKGTPSFPGMWIIPIICMHYEGPMNGKYDYVRKRMLKRERDRNLAKRAKTIKTDIDLERSFLDEILPHAEKGLVPGGKSKTIPGGTRGHTRLPSPKAKSIIIDMGA